MLTHYVAVYIPSTVNVNHPIDTSAIKAAAAKELSRVFGGCTAIPAIGYWVANDGTLIEESVTILKSYYDDNPNAIDIVRSLASDIKVELLQESVTIESNDGLEFV